MKILITGAGGFIGYHLVKKCLNYKNEIVGIDNINDYYDVNLKKARINILQSECKLNNSKFKFHQENIEDYNAMENIANLKPELVITTAQEKNIFYKIQWPIAIQI